MPRRESVPAGYRQQDTGSGPDGQGGRRRSARILGITAGAVSMLVLSTAGALLIEWVRSSDDPSTAASDPGADVLDGVTLPSTVSGITDLTSPASSTSSIPVATAPLSVVTFQADGGQALVTGVVPTVEIAEQIAASLAGIYGPENVVTTGVVVDPPTPPAQWMASIDALVAALGGFDDYRIRFDGDTLTGFVGGGAEFASSSADVPAGYDPILTFVAGVLSRDPSLTLVVTGHTDSSGTDEANLALSQARAQAVVDRLVQQGSDGARLVAAGKGPFNPTAPNDTAEGRARNRRVELTLAIGAVPPVDS